MTNAQISTKLSSTIVESVYEGNYAVSEFTVSPKLTSATTVGASLIGVSAADGAGPDFSPKYEVHMDTLLTTASDNVWNLVTLNAVAGDTFVLNAGYTSFQLRTFVNTDKVQEFGDSVTFAVSQLSTSVGLDNSWYVANTINIKEPTVTPVKIELATPGKTLVNGVYETKVDEGHAAVAIFNLTGSGSNGILANPYSTDGKTYVDVSVAGSGATPDAGSTLNDFGKLCYRTATDTNSFTTENLNSAGNGLKVGSSASDWTLVPTGLEAHAGQIGLVPGTKAFELGVFVNIDGKTEYHEAVTFAASQTADSNTIQDSWWVSGTVNLMDPGSDGSAYPITPVAIELDAANKTSQAGVPGANTNTDEGHDAIAKFNFIDGNHGATSLGGLSTNSFDNTWLNVSVTGVGAIPYTTSIAPYDFGDLQYKASGSASWGYVPTSGDHKGQISLAKDTTSFELKVTTHTDNITEYGSAVTFAVSQTADSNTLKDSWWVSGTVNINDPGSVGSSNPVNPVVIELANVNKALGANTKVDEGQDAVAKFIFTDGHSEPTVKSLGDDSISAPATTWLDVSVTGVGATPDANGQTNDFGDLYYRSHKGSADTPWAKVEASGDHAGQIGLSSGTDSFELKVATHIDDRIEYNSAVAFAVSQTADSITLKDSWWVSGTVNLVDAGSSDSHTFVGGVGADLFTAHANVNEVFVITNGTSVLGPLTNNLYQGHFDTIDGLNVGDKIDFGFVEALTAANIKDNRADGFPFNLNGGSDGFFSEGKAGMDSGKEVFVYKQGDDAYILADTNGSDHTVQLNSDVFIKITGGASTSIEQIQGWLT